MRTEPRVSVRLVWPFARLAGARPKIGVSLARYGVSAEAFGNPETRIPYAAAIELLSRAVQESGDEAVGLHAGVLLESTDFDVVEAAARCLPTLRDAVLCMSRYHRLLNEGGEIVLEESGETAMWFHRVFENVPEHPAVDDVAIAAALTFARRNLAAWIPPLEIWVRHTECSYAAEYERLFGAKVRLGAPHAGLMIPRARLDAPMLHANPRVAAAFGLHAQRALDRLEAADGTAGRVRKTVAAHLGIADVSMETTARQLAMSIATLRRRLEEEGTTYSDILDGLRRSLAERHVRERGRAISEVAFSLGFSNVTAFHRAFKRWTGIAPTEYRARARAM